MWRGPSMESSNHQPPDGYTTTVVTDDFLEQILDIPSSYSGLTVNGDVVGGDTVSLTSAVSALNHYHQQQSQLFPLGLSLENGGDDAGAAFDLKTDRELVNMRNMYPMFESSQPPAIHDHVIPSHVHQSFLGQPTHTTTAVNVAQPPAIRPRVRARRGQATDPHSIAERLRRERISEKIKALQELVPSCNKTDRAAMLDEILDYVKFLRLQVKVLSMSRLGGAGAVAQIVSDIPRSIEGENGSCGPGVWEKWSNEETEQEVAKLMEEDVGAAMQFLQTKSLCIMPVSLAALVYPTTQQQRDVDPSFFKPEPPALL